MKYCNIVALVLLLNLPIQGMAAGAWIADGGVELGSVYAVGVENSGVNLMAVYTVSSNDADRFDVSGTCADAGADSVNYGVALNMDADNYQVLYSAILAARHGQSSDYSSQPYYINFYGENCITYDYDGIKLEVLVVDRFKFVAK